MKRFTFLSTCLVVIQLLSTSLVSQTNLTKYSGNPVLGPGPDAWDGVGVSGATVLFDGSIFQMWYTGYHPDVEEIGYATSSDGKNWTKHAGNPVLTRTVGSWDGNINDVCVVFANGEYKMYYSGAANGSSPNRIGLATSNDGIYWTKYSGNPVLTNGPSGSWDQNLVRRPSVIYDGNVYHMWFEGHRDRMRIGYATSSDGIHWQKHSGNPVVDISGILGSFDEQVASAPSVIWDGSQYVMYYSGHDNRGCGVAYSLDGIDWTKSNANPVLTPGAPNEWDKYVGGTTVLFQDNTYKVWYNGADGVTGGIGYAEGPVDQPPTPLETSDIQIEWHTATPHTANHGFAHVELIGRKIYLPGGGNPYNYNNPTLSIYDVDTDTWSTGANMPSPKAGNSGTTMLNGMFYHVGGEGPYAGRWSPEVEVYDPTTDQWTLKANWPTPRRDIGVASLDGKVYVVGGHSNYYNMSSDVDIYNPLTNSWSKGPNFPMNISGATTISLNNRLYVFGGYTGPSQRNRTQTDKVFGLDLVSNSWQELTPMPYARTYATAGIYNGKIYLIGGERNNKNIWQEGAFEDIWEYSPDEDKFRQIISNGFQLVYGNGFHAAVLDNEIFFVGIYTYDSSTNTFSFVPTLQRGQFTLPNQPPTASAGEDQNYQCTSPNGAQVPLNGSGSSDPDGDPLTFTWRENGNIIAGPTASPTSEVTLSLGSHTIELTVEDGNGGTGTDEVIIDVVDTTPPVITAALILRELKDFRPGDRGRGDFEVLCSAMDACDPTPATSAMMPVPAGFDDPQVEIEFEFKAGAKSEINFHLNKNGKRSIELAGEDEALLRAQLANILSSGGVAVANGQILELRFRVKENKGEKFNFTFMNGVLVKEKVEGDNPEITMMCSSADGSGNQSSKTVTADFNVPVTPAKISSAVDEDSNIKTSADLPRSFLLEQNYPNPFNPQTEIRFQIPEASHVVVRIFNVIGEEIRSLVNRPYEAGYHSVRWNGKDDGGNDVASGVYLYQIQAGEFSQVMKMSLLR